MTTALSSSFLEIVNTTLDIIKPLVEKINESITDKPAVKHHMVQLLQIVRDSKLLYVAAGYTYNTGQAEYNYMYLYHLIMTFAKYDMPITAGLLTSPRIGLHSLLHFDSAKQSVIHDCLEGKVVLSFCMSGPEGGSDILSINTTAVKTASGWTINGIKKWITGGIYATKFVVLAKTTLGEPSSYSSYSLFLVDADKPGCQVSAMNTQGAQASGTARIVFEDVQVGNEDMIGVEGGAFLYCMDTLIEERWITGTSALAMGRRALDEALQWSHDRKINGKQLNSIETVRMRLVEMQAALEPMEAYSQQIATLLSDARNNNSMTLEIAAKTAIFKGNATTVATLCIQNAQLILGGRAFERCGRGKCIADLHDQIHGMKCAGGTVDVLMNAASKILVKSKM